ncbi:hypothetical protein [Hyperthermus butylicus]|uniref:Uncharacterized protein n=1 Tax=Hyperthermus butylicus (strain DSM 5456 / JCM 9403 / PLM1-5) TaxID=415426 RepID=A2BL35_HYPBU|nr:hypothetical protein [Hyperthermus butylicus]ABM80696.1 hypothetical protein Hbut_0845 [Hyperthermus butylicus DSM 5456]
MTGLITNLIFAEIGEGRELLRRAATADLVLVVGDGVEALVRASRYRELGVEVQVYPLSPRDSPTLFSILGLVGWLREQAVSATVVVEGYGGEKLVEAAYMVVSGYNLSELPVQLIARLQSPLHLRTLVVLDALARSGVNLAAEAKRHINAAFTGGDAYRASLVEHAADIVVQKARLGLGEELACLARVYRAAMSGQPVTGSGECSLVARLAERLDVEGVGAVKTVSIARSGNEVKAYVGCKLLLHDNSCMPELEAAEPLLRELVERWGLELKGVELVDPEEAACIAYEGLAGYTCG